MERPSCTWAQGRRAGVGAGAVVMLVPSLAIDPFEAMAESLHSAPGGAMYAVVKRVDRLRSRY